MNDTSDRMEKEYAAILMRRTGQERLKMGCSMYAMRLGHMRCLLIKVDSYLRWNDKNYGVIPVQAGILIQSGARIFSFFKNRSCDPVSLWPGR